MKPDNAKWSEVSLREFIESKIAADRELSVCELKGVREWVATIFTAHEKALELQHKETGRRLAELNGEAERLRRIQADYWPRETAEGYIKDQAQREKTLLDRVEETRTNLEKQTAETTKRLEQRIEELRLERKGDTNEFFGRTLAVVALLVAVAAAIIAAVPG